MDTQEQFARLRAVLNQHHEVTPDCLRPVIGQILPGGRMFDLLKLGASMDVDRAFRRVRDAASDILEGAFSNGKILNLSNLVQEYLEHAETCVLQTIDLTSPAHQAFLLTLRELHTPPKPPQPTVFLIAGPSASGKDFVTRSVFEALRARGYYCQFVLKYIQRESRPEERRISPFLRYQIVVSPQEFEQLERVGEIICPYWKYGSRYGFSTSNLARLIVSQDADANICIMSAFEQVEDFVCYLQTIGFKVIPVLLHARLEICRRRLLDRLLSLKKDPSFDESKAVAELWLRAEEVAHDIARIEKQEPIIERYYMDRISNDHENDSRPIQELYRFMVAELRHPKSI